MNKKIPGSAADPLWFKDAIIYETHVKAFFDSTNDGIGDFQGLLRKLDYLQDLGVTCLWLLPIFPSPLRDDGYDIADYTNVHSAYGTLDDFKAFVDAAHDRNIQVLIELVVNHTSDHHPWFQRARKAAPGSPERDFYVWSDNDEKYSGSRIIFVDTETSNWAWDPEAKAYYWHRFFSHQPDLNYDNPEVLREVIDVMRFWLGLGVDAFRLDAVPYLVERDGTTCENLAETHTVIKQIRAELDSEYENRILLAEANQWPADVRPYFGDGDECHMAFHFPLMPRIFMALQREDRYPIVEIMDQTPVIPETCQWAIFLRNHDEMTLEMVTDVERDYMYRAYSADPRMRCNIGIRRRLAPLMENNRLRIELLNSLLFSFPGTPVVYYGDEIGMGDNIYLPDRNGVRTPMQWSEDRNAGFSRANPARLYSPVIMDSVYGHQAVNVEAELEDRSSLLHWMKKLIAIRKAYRVFGRGTMEFLESANRKVLPYVRRHEETVVLCVANLSRFAQPCELNLAEFEGMTPVELMGNTPFPRIGELPYFLTLPPYGFYWFELQAERKPTMAYRIHAPVEPVEEPAELLILALRDDGPALFEGRPLSNLEQRVLMDYLPRQRWFGAKARVMEHVKVEDWARLEHAGSSSFLALVGVNYSEGQRELYQVPLALNRGRETDDMLQHRHQFVLSRVTTPHGPGAVFDAVASEKASLGLLDLIENQRSLASRNGRIHGIRLDDYDELRGPRDDALAPALCSAEQSNTSIRYGSRMIMKLFRKLERGRNVDYEVSRYLREEAKFEHIPVLAGAIEYVRGDGDVTTLAMLQELVQNQGDGWESFVDELGRYYERNQARSQPLAPMQANGRSLSELAATKPPEWVRDIVGLDLERAATLGARTAELHLALGRQTDNPDFQPEVMTGDDLTSLAGGMVGLASQALELLERGIESLPEDARELTLGLVRRREAVLAEFDQLRTLRSALVKTRVHGDFHLGQVLVVSNDYCILDFEGEPARSIEERRAKRSPFKDVAGMLRSFSYAAFSSLLDYSQRRGVGFDTLRPYAELWETWTSAMFLREYFARAGDAPFVPKHDDDRKRILRAFTLEKAFYELFYELNNRPAWIRIPLLGIDLLLGRGQVGPGRP